MSKYIYLLAVILILGLCGWIWQQSKRIDNLTAENQIQAQTIEQQQKANQQLISHLEQERQAVEKSRKSANEMRNKLEIVQNEIKSILAQDSCAKADLPNGVADSIKRLHRQNNHKH